MRHHQRRATAVPAPAAPGSAAAIAGFSLAGALAPARSPASAPSVRSARPPREQAQIRP
jgi:hypothetical protein